MLEVEKAIFGENCTLKESEKGRLIRSLGQTIDWMRVLVEERTGPLAEGMTC